MGRFRILVVAALGATLSATLAGAQVPARVPAGAFDLSAHRDWRATFGRGTSMPDHERLIVVATDGRVVQVVEGEESQVALPIGLHFALEVGTFRATLVHNHLADRGFSCADLRQLAKAGVDGVVVVGDRGSVFEAGAGERYDVAVFEEARCRQLMSEAATTLAGQIGQGFDDRSAFADQVPHLFASALARAGIITYRASPAVQAAMIAFRHHLAFERVSAAMAGELRRHVAGLKTER